MPYGEVLAQGEAQIEYSIKRLRLKGVRLKNVGVAFDWHDQPYYGQPMHGMVGTQPKRGTCYAFSFLTASAVSSDSFYHQNNDNVQIQQKLSL
jgi:hypothetical protein